MIDGVGASIDKLQKGADTGLNSVYDQAQRVGSRVAANAVQLSLALHPATPPGIRNQALQVLAQGAAKQGAPSQKSQVVRAVVSQPEAAKPGRASPVPSRKASIAAPLMQVDAFVRGAGDTLSFGKANEIEAGLEALLETGVRTAVPSLNDGRSLGERYETRLALQQERDRYDAEHRSSAHTAGQAGGLVAGLAVGAGLGRGGAALIEALPKGARIVRNAAPVKRIGFDKRGVTTLAGVGGAAVGGLDQVIQDIAAGRVSTASDYGASLASGVVGGVVGRMGGPTAAAAVTGALTPTLKSAGRGELATAAEVRDGALYGAVGGAVTGRGLSALGKYGAAAASPRVKGQLGEGLSYLKSVARDGRLPKTQVRRQFEGRTTIADQVLASGALLEAKFGRWAALSRAQRAALRQLGPQYLIDHFLPKDIGRLLGAGAGVASGHAAGVQQSAS
ncbi:hypothetical protein [Phenylobacterium sp.]|uniref:hypothetical protein n=1 Tax=Phenylobacterium sp. TaxID=1871053 RepID=UPI0028963F43|nr:hypothetical protein [Phenylobacterium sp.]